NFIHAFLLQGVESVGAMNPEAHIVSDLSRMNRQRCTPASCSYNNNVLCHDRRFHDDDMSPFINLCNRLTSCRHSFIMKPQRWGNTVALRCSFFLSWASAYSWLTSLSQVSSNGSACGPGKRCRPRSFRSNSIHTEEIRAVIRTRYTQTMTTSMPGVCITA